MTNKYKLKDGCKPFTYVSDMKVYNFCPDKPCRAPAFLGSVFSKSIELGAIDSPPEMKGVNAPKPDPEPAPEPKTTSVAPKAKAGGK